MGRQKGDGNRTKSRPSSSNFAASLLQSGSTGIGFGGYIGSSRIDPTLSKESSSLLDVDGEVVQHFRRLSKKDPVTKLKALASLCDLFKQSSGSDLIQILPQWVFEYKRLVQDNSRQVRQVAHDAMANLAVTIGRGLAPHLKSVMGAWWIGQFDPYPEVAEAASRSLQAAFPVQDKRLEALIFCENEIFLYLDENLKLTPETISDKTAPAEELEEMHQRVVSSSLLALASLLDVMLEPSSKISISKDGSLVGLDLKNTEKARCGALAAADKMCHNHKFFQEFLKSHNSRVRSAIYQVFVRFIKYTPEIFTEGDMKILAGIVLGSFQEKDPICHSSMWDMLLLFIKRFPEAWKFTSVRKIILPRFWCFLRHGCYGSQQASYSCLLPMLASIPPVAIIPGEHFFIDFFQNVWAGKSKSLASPADRNALFSAVKECLLWILKNVSRYLEDESGDTEKFRVRIVEFIIFKLMWNDYIILGKSNMDESAVTDKDGSLVAKKLHSSKEKVQDVPNLKYPKDFIQDLGNCIIDILSNTFVKYPNMLDVFCTQFQVECLKFISQVGNNTLQEADQHMDRLSDFFVLLGKHSMTEEEKWPLIHLARPFVAKSFPLIKSKASPAAVSIFAVIVSVFGPSVLPIKSVFDERGESHVQISCSYDQVPEPELLLQFFKTNLAAWCLHGKDDSTGSRIDLLLSFLEDLYFQRQWDWLVGCAAAMESESVEMDGRCLNDDHIAVLAILMEKVRHRFIHQSPIKKSNKILGFEAKDWHSRRLDAVAVEVARCASLKNPSHVRFLRCVLGGTDHEDVASLISKEAVNLVMVELLKQLVALLMESPNVWAKYAGSLILPHRLEGNTSAKKPSSEGTLQIASFATQILGESFFSLKILDGDYEVVPHILAASIILAWESRISDHSGLSCISVKLQELGEDARNPNNIDMDSPHSEELSIDECAVEKVNEEKLLVATQEPEVVFLRLIKDLWSKIASSCMSFSLFSLQHLRSVLIESIRCAIFEGNTYEVEYIVTLCTEWMVEMIGYTCKDQNEEQQLLSDMLSPRGAWPFWAQPPVLGESELVTLKYGVVFNEADKDMHTRFVMFVEKIGSLLGQEKVFIGSLAMTSQMTEDHRSDQIRNENSSCRIWLAVEVLCAWSWPGSSVKQSLLSFLCECAKTGPGHLQWKMVNLVINNMFLGALNNNAASNSYPLNPWVISEDEVDKIEEPFLRALLMLLIVLFKDGTIWNKEDSLRILLNYFLKEEFIDISVNSSVRVLPYIINILTSILRKRTVNFEECNEVLPLAEGHSSRLQKPACHFLERAASGPPLILCRKGQSDVEEWINLSVSFFPLSSLGGVRALTEASLADISAEEKDMLLALFQKQSSREAISGCRATAAEQRALLDQASSTATYCELHTELTLVRLMAVTIGYCWQGFGEDEWAFVLAQLRKWLDAAVGCMEDLAEGINDAVKNIDPSGSSDDDILDNIENVIVSSNISSLELTEMAVFIFSLLYGLQILDGAGSTSSLSSLKSVNWERAEARAFENVLRLFFTTGIAESIASSSSAGEKAGVIVALARHQNAHFWETVANVVVNTPSRAKQAAVHATELWGLNKGAISALYAILFSVYPISGLQLAAYHFLSSDPVLPLAVTKGVVSARLEETSVENQEVDHATFTNSSLEELSVIRDEISVVLQTSLSELLESHFTGHIWVQYLLAWSLFLTRLQAVPSVSSARECMVQYAQDSGCLSTLLDCLFQLIQVKQNSSSGLKKHNVAAIEASVPGFAAKRSAATYSLSFAVEALRPVGIDQMSALAGAIYGLMLYVLPACVRDWFTSLRDRSAAAFIEAFTTACCSPQLLDDEFFKIQAGGVADDSLSIRANRSTREVTASYKKEEAALDIVIRLPPSYPLRAVDVGCTRNIGVIESRLRKWMLSMTSFIRNQNGAVAEAIRIWKRNIDREFEGVEECPICYSIIHTTHNKLPELPCKTCKHKYHSACLFKWFSTSHKSTCPLCQSPF